MISLIKFCQVRDLSQLHLKQPFNPESSISVNASFGNDEDDLVMIALSSNFIWIICVSQRSLISRAQFSFRCVFRRGIHGYGLFTVVTSSGTPRGFQSQGGQNCKIRPFVSVIEASRRGRKQWNLGELNLESCCPLCSSLSVALDLFHVFLEGIPDCLLLFKSPLIKARIRWPAMLPQHFAENHLLPNILSCEGFHFK